MLGSLISPDNGVGVFPDLSGVVAPLRRCERAASARRLLVCRLLCGAPFDASIEGSSAADAATSDKLKTRKKANRRRQREKRMRGWGKSFFFKATSFGLKGAKNQHSVLGTRGNDVGGRYVCVAGTGKRVTLKQGTGTATDEWFFAAGKFTGKLATGGANAAHHFGLSKTCNDQVIQKSALRCDELYFRLSGAAGATTDERGF